jgi:spore coat protein CotH
MKSNQLIIFSILITLLFASCEEIVLVPDGLINGGLESHNIGYEANYDVVFDDSKVQRIDIVFTADEWSDMQSDLSSKISGSSGGPNQTFDNENPSYFPADIYYNDLLWEHVGVRYKGNSSLRANSGKLPLRFNFDEFEDSFEGISNQRFYGFKELSMSSNYNDPSLIREKAADDIFRDFGVPAVRTAFYEVYIDSGNGAEYFGVYTMCEVVFDTFLEGYFGSNTGNCYKPEDDGASFAIEGFTLDGFALKTNEDADKSDIQQMFDFLNSDTRTTNPEQWRSDLESVFDVDGFLKYLAVNNTIQNWDTYGRMPHNYYLYHDPADDLIKWIVWDNNEAFQNGKNGGSLPFAMNDTGFDWPLVSFMATDDVYFAQYKEYIELFINTTFSENRMATEYSTYQSLLQESADAERSGYSYVNGQFNSAINTLKNHNASRVAAANDFVN